MRSPMYASPIYVSRIYDSPMYDSPIYDSPSYDNPIYGNLMYVLSSLYVVHGSDGLRGAVFGKAAAWQGICSCVVCFLAVD